MNVQACEVEMMRISLLFVMLALGVAKGDEDTLFDPLEYVDPLIGTANDGKSRPLFSRNGR